MASLIRHGLLKEGLAVDVAPAARTRSGWSRARRLRRDRARRDAAGHRRLRDLPADPRQGRAGAGADADRARLGRRPRRRPRLGRRRLPRQAVRVRRAARAPARAGTARRRSSGRACSRWATCGSTRRRAASGAVEPPIPLSRQGVRAARDVHAPARRGALAPASARARVGLRLREPLQRRSTSTSATCAPRSTSRSAGARSRRCAAPATGCARTAALEPTADPAARHGCLRGRDGGRPRRSPARSSTCASARTSRSRSTGSCGCARTTWPCSSARPGTPLAAEHRSRFVETGETYAQVLDSQRSRDRRHASRSGAHPCSARAELRQALAGADLHEPRLGAGPRRAVAHLRDARDAAAGAGSCSWSESRARIAPRRCAACATSC